MGWPKQTPMVLYCHTGRRSIDAASFLAGHGFTNVRSMTGGLEAWSCQVDSSVPRYEVARDPASGRAMLRPLRSAMS
jgi:predicted sulfurtransferase